VDVKHSGGATKVLLYIK